MQTYQVAFKFQFQQDFTNQQVQIQIADTNNFVMQSNERVQLQPYQDSYTPPLLNFSVSNKLMFFNIAKGSAAQGLQGLAWATFTDAGNNETLNLDLQVPGGLMNVYYAVLNTSSSGQLKPGQNTISVVQ
ncbi:hypothetical protein [Pseudoxanthomonas broegbernensis]|uniref:hypothetical protein n=1 Tax=Pseudoxanthomonas broegbernensis TaxID=83619 RepID=UPI001391A2CA|nr:hypothetical protein [Pseudoxanthomonas broegbernensis]MBB6064898.1 hypothetical protein [Pseudoxanthomonas broegbernensis]